MRPHTLAILFILIPSALALEHRAPKDHNAGTAELPLPGDLVTTLEVPTKPILIGSSWVLHYVIHNRNASKLTWKFGCDYRGKRPTRVWLEAVDREGTLAVDPLGHTSVNDMGGIGGHITIPPFSTNVITVNPSEYVRLDRPGRWTLRMFHDLGMGPSQGDHDPRWASATVALTMPDDIEANQVVKMQERLIEVALEDRVAHRWPTAGERGSTAPDFKAMAVPVFLMPLVERVRQGSRMAIAGIAEIPTPEACDALLEILEMPVQRPLQVEEDYSPAAHPWCLALLALAERFAPPVSDQAWAGTGDPRLLATIDVARRERICQTVAPLIHHEDASVKRAAGMVLARCLVDTGSLLPLIGETLTTPANESAFHDLLSAYRSSGAPIPDPISGPAAAMVWLDHLLYHPQERPEGWKEILTTLLVHPAPRVREWAVMILPRDEPERWASFVIKVLQDDDANVRSRAIYASGDYPGPALVPFLQEAMLREREPSTAAEYIGKIAGKSAAALAVIYYLEKSPERFATSNSVQHVFRVLGTFDVRSSWTTEREPDDLERHAIAEHLRAFIASQHEVIDRGALGLPDKSWPIDLLPEGWWIVLPDAQTWPPGRR